MPYLIYYEIEPRFPELEIVTTKKRLKEIVEDVCDGSPYNIASVYELAHTREMPFDGENDPVQIFDLFASKLK